MAHNRPWYKRNAGDFLMGTVHMDLETRGAYSILIDLLNDRDRPLPDEPRFIAGLLNITVRRWSAIRERLLAERGPDGLPNKIYVDAHGCLTNPRFEREREERRRGTDEAVENGRRGGKKSAAKRAAEAARAQGSLELSPDYLPEKPEIISAKGDSDFSESEPAPPEIKDLAQAPPQAPRARKSPESRVEEIHTPTTLDSLPARIDVVDANALADNLCRIAGVRNVDPGRIVEHTQLVAEWVKAGADPPLLERAVASARDAAARPIHSLRYCDPTVRQHLARRDHPNGSASDLADFRDPLLRRYVASGGKLPL